MIAAGARWRTTAVAARRAVGRAVPASIRADAPRLARFAISGVASTLLYLAVVALLVLSSSLPPVAASMYAYLLAIAFSYLLQSRFTFRLSDDRPGRIASFVAVSLGGLAISYGAMVVLHGWLELPAIAAAGVVCVLIPLVNYVLLKRLVFSRPASAIAEPRR